MFVIPRECESPWTLVDGSIASPLRSMQMHDGLLTWYQSSGGARPGEEGKRGKGVAEILFKIELDIFCSKISFLSISLPFAHF